MRKRTIAISLSALAVAALAGGAYAASGSGSGPPPKPFAITQEGLIKDAANRLHVSSAQLTGALRQAWLDQIKAQIKAQHLPAARAKALMQKLEHAPGLPPFAPGLFGAAMIPRGIAAPRMLHAQITATPPFLLPPAVLAATAKYLGLSGQQVLKELRSGKTLAQIARERGKSTAGLEHAIVTAVRSALAKSLAAGRAAEQRLVAGLEKQVQMMVNSKGPAGLLPLAQKVQVPAGAAGPPLLGWLPPPIVRAYIGPQVQRAPGPR